MSKVTTNTSPEKLSKNIFRSTHKIIIALIFGFTISLFANPQNVRKETNFNRDWKFIKGEHKGAEAIDFNVSEWQTLNLPHDWAIAGPFDPDGESSTGKLPWKDVAWYRKTFTVNKEDAGKRVYFNFDGVMAFPQIYIMVS